MIWDITMVTPEASTPQAAVPGQRFCEANTTPKPLAARRRTVTSVGARWTPLCTRAVAAGAAKPIGTEGTSAHRAASIALLPSTDCRYSVVKNADAHHREHGDEVEGDSHAETTSPGTARGRSWWREVLPAHEQGAKSRPTVTDMTYRTCQPSDGICLQAVDDREHRGHRGMPIQSKRPGDGSFDSGSRTGPRTSSRTIARAGWPGKPSPAEELHGAPLGTEPSATPAVITPDQMAMARARCRGSVNSERTRASVEGDQGGAADAEQCAGRDEHLGALRVRRRQGRGTEGGGADQQHLRRPMRSPHRAHRIGQATAKA
ncbi:hypothetical protein SGLAM104S_09286 [Streptomyces glaucescens]